MKVTVKWIRGEHHSGGVNVWENITSINYELPALTFTDKDKHSFYVTVDDMESFKVEEGEER